MFGTMNGYSQTPEEERLKALQEIMPEIFDEGKIDWEKLRAGNYYVINGNELVLMLESAMQETMDAVLTRQRQKVVALDRIFENNDQLKTNTALQMKNAGITFLTI